MSNTADISIPKLKDALAQDKDKYDCFSCRVIGNVIFLSKIPFELTHLSGATTFVGLGGFTYFTGHRQLRQQQATILKSGSRLGMAPRRAGITIMSMGMAGIGIYRLFNWEERAYSKVQTSIKGMEFQEFRPQVSGTLRIGQIVLIDRLESWNTSVNCMAISKWNVLKILGIYPYSSQSQYPNMFLRTLSSHDLRLHVVFSFVNKSLGLDGDSIYDGQKLSAHQTAL